MICEKCHKKLAKVRILKGKGDTEEALSTPIEQHFCEDCSRDYIESDHQFKQGRWSKPTKRFISNVGRLPPKLKP